MTSFRTRRARAVVSFALSTTAVSALLAACSSDDAPPDQSAKGATGNTTGGAAGSSSLSAGGRAGSAGNAGNAGSAGPAFKGSNEKQTPFFGSTSGTAFPPVLCDEGEVLVGADFKQNPGAPYSGSLYQLHPVCALLGDAGGALALGNPTTKSAGMGNSNVAGGVVLASCAAGQAVTAMTVSRLNELPNLSLAYDLVFACSPLGLSGGAVTTTGAAVPATSTSAKGTSTAGTATCDPGKIAVGFAGKYGSEADQLGLVCRSFAKTP
jgi:hypothetical protein